MSQIQWTVSLVLIGLFTVAVIGFAINFAADNNSPVSLSDDPEISSLYDNSGEDLTEFDTNAESTYTSILNSSISDSGSTTAGGGQFALTATNTVGVVSNILKVGYTKIFGSSSGFGIFITTFLGLIVLITILYLWKTWAGKMPD